MKRLEEGDGWEYRRPAAPSSSDLVMTATWGKDYVHGDVDIGRGGCGTRDRLTDVRVISEVVEHVLDLDVLSCPLGPWQGGGHLLQLP